MRFFSWPFRMVGKAFRFLIGLLIVEEGVQKLWPVVGLIVIASVFVAVGWVGKVLWDKAAVALRGAQPMIVVVAADGQDIATSPMRSCVIKSLEPSKEGSVIMELSSGRGPFPEVLLTINPDTPIRVNGHQIWPEGESAAIFPEDKACEFLRVLKAELRKSSRARLIVQASDRGAWTLEEGTVEIHPSEDVRWIDIRNERGIP